MSSIPPPPPVPAKPAEKIPASNKFKASEEYFTIGPLSASEPELVFRFPNLPKSPSTILLKTVVNTVTTGVGINTQYIQPKQLYHVLNKFRATALLLKQYNQIGENTDEGTKYARFHALQLFSAFGFQISKPGEPVEIPGLDSLIAALEDFYADDIAHHLSLIERGVVDFDGLQELYKPGVTLSGATGLASGMRAGFRVLNSYFEERRTLFGTEKSFKMQLEFLASLGKDIVSITFEEVLSGWISAAKTRSIADLMYAPATEAELSDFAARGSKYVNFSSTTGTRFVQYQAGGFFPHYQQTNRTPRGPVSDSGRIIIDAERGISFGHHASQGFDEATSAMINTTGRYRRMKNDSSRSTVPSDMLLTFNSTISEELLPLLWPSLIGFSLAAKAWGHVLVDSLKPIDFNDRAFDQLVLSEDRKRLIRALVSFGDKPFDDIIEGKSGGSVFLLHGPPGVGKTLTAEAIAEVLHRPLYYVTMGELGTTPEDMEKRLSNVLELCAGWSALTLIDEADVFLEKRSTSDILRNAMVCVMLRLLEYHNGILFLTTNRVKEFDPAFESRVTVALKYSHLPPEARKQVWINLIERVSIDIGEIDYEKLKGHILNGRQIKNAVRLAMALARDAKQPLNQNFLDQTISIMMIGHVEILSEESHY